MENSDRQAKQEANDGALRERQHSDGQVQSVLVGDELNRTVRRDRTNKTKRGYNIEPSYKDVYMINMKMN